MHILTFYPLGNADTCLVELGGGCLLLFDYANKRAGGDRPFDLAEALRQRLKAHDRTSLDVVAFTHLDDDHIHGSCEIFHLQHLSRYPGAGRIIIDELWVPAAVIVEDQTGRTEEARIIQREARFRLKEGRGIRVFSRPHTLGQWLADQGIDLADRAAFITDAGQLVPGFEKSREGVEFFVHSPFAAYHNGDLIDRNTCSLVLQGTFMVDGVDTHVIFCADAPYDVLTDIVHMTLAHHNETRLRWHVFKLPHHCSYTSLGPEKGKEVTEPVREVAWLFEEQAAPGGIIVSMSDPIPTTDTDQPPHRQAANYYRQLCSTDNRDFRVTMEHPSPANPAPLVITIGPLGATIKKRIEPSGVTIPSRSAPRAG